MMDLQYVAVRWGKYLAGIPALAMGMFCGWLVVSGRAVQYVHPRYVPLMGGAALMLLLLAAAGLLLPGRHRVQQPLWAALVTGLVVVSGVCVSPAVPGTAAENVRLGGTTRVQTVMAATPAPEAVTAEEAEALQEEPVTPAPGDTGPVVMEDVNFVRWLDELNREPERYAGREITLTGLVFRRPEFAPEQFVPARMMMTCCAADLQPVGLLCRYDGAGELKAGQWVKVTGKLEMMDWKDGKMPGVRAVRVEPAEKPRAEYVYPY